MELRHSVQLWQVIASNSKWAAPPTLLGYRHYIEKRLSNSFFLLWQHAESQNSAEHSLYHGLVKIVTRRASGAFQCWRKRARLQTYLQRRVAEAQLNQESKAFNQLQQFATITAQQIYNDTKCENLILERQLRSAYKTWRAVRRSMLTQEYTVTIASVKLFQAQMFDTMRLWRIVYEDQSRARNALCQAIDSHELTQTGNYFNIWCHWTAQNNSRLDTCFNGTLILACHHTSRSFMKLYELKQAGIHSNKMMTKALVRWVYTKLSLHCRLWRVWGREQASFEKKTLRSLTLMVIKIVRSAFNTWRQAALRVKIEQQLTAVHARITSSRRLRTAWFKWKQILMAVVEKEEVIEDATMNFVVSLVSRRFKKWCRYSVISKQRSHTVTYAEYVMRQTRTRVYFRTWTRFCFGAKKERFLMTHVENRAMWHAWTGWRQQTKEDYHKAFKVAVILKHLKRESLTEALEHWHIAASNLSRNKAACAMSLKRAVAALQMRVLPRAWNIWRLFLHNCDKNQAMMSCANRRRLYSGYQVWCRYATESKEVSCVVTGARLYWQHRERMEAFSRWLALTYTDMSKKNILHRSDHHYVHYQTNIFFSQWYNMMSLLNQDQDSASSHTRVMLNQYLLKACTQWKYETSRALILEANNTTAVLNWRYNRLKSFWSPWYLTTARHSQAFRVEAAFTTLWTRKHVASSFCAWLQGVRKYDDHQKRDLNAFSSVLLFQAETILKRWRMMTGMEKKAQDAMKQVQSANVGQAFFTWYSLMSKMRKAHESMDVLVATKELRSSEDAFSY